MGADGKSLSIFGNNLIGIIHPSGTAGFLEDLKFEKSQDGKLGVEFDLSWKGGIFGTDYKAIVYWAVSEEGHIASKVGSDTAPTAVSKEALTKMDAYFRDTFITVLGDAQPKRQVQVMTLRHKAVLSALTEIRVALQNYYGDNKGNFPAELKNLAPKYLKRIPAITLVTAKRTNSVAKPKAAAGADSCVGVTGSGGWLFYNDPNDSAAWGNVAIDSAEVSPEGKRWCEY